MAFVKGQSGNPSGARPKSPEQREFEAKCKEWCRLFAFDKLKRAVESHNEKRADWALEVLLDRAFGKSAMVQQIDAEITANPGASAKELADGIAGLIGSEAPGGGPVDKPDQVDSGK